MIVDFVKGAQARYDNQEGVFFYAKDTKALFLNGIKLTSGVNIDNIVKVSDLNSGNLNFLLNTITDNQLHIYYILNDTDTPYLWNAAVTCLGVETINTGDLLVLGKYNSSIIKHVIGLNAKQPIKENSSGKWGSITGNIINQTDLQQVLNSIINDCSQSAQQLRNALDEMSSNLQEQDSQLEEQWMLLNQYQLTLEQHRLKIAELEATVNSGIQIDAITHSFIPYSRWVILTKPDAQDRPTDTSKLRKNVIYYVYDDEDYDILFTVDADRGILTLSGCTIDGDTLIIPYSAQIQVVNDGTTLRLSKA